MNHKQETLIAKHFTIATKKVLNTMAFVDPVAGTPYTPKDKIMASDISAIIGITGACTGTISASFSREAALTVLRGMLGGDIENPEQEAADVVGEIINMVSGMARASLSESGLTMHGSTPSVVAGKDHKLKHQSNAPVVAIPFSLGESSFTVEFSLK